MGSYLLYGFLALLTLPWWRAVLEHVARDAWSAAASGEADFPSVRRGSPDRSGMRRRGARPAAQPGAAAIMRETHTLRDRRTQGRRWEAGFGRRGL